LPGKQFLNNFLSSWTNLISELPNHNIQWGVSNKYSPNIYYVRNMCLGGNNISGIKQKPFDGKIDYKIFLNNLLFQL